MDFFEKSKKVIVLQQKSVYNGKIKYEKNKMILRFYNFNANEVRQ